MVCCVVLSWHGVCLSTCNKAIATASKQINKDLVKRGGLKSLSEGQLSAPLFFLFVTRCTKVLEELGIERVAGLVAQTGNDQLVCGQDI